MKCKKSPNEPIWTSLATQRRARAVSPARAGVMRLLRLGSEIKVAVMAAEAGWGMQQGMRHPI